MALKGNVLGTNRYDEYGASASPVAGRFQYTGQAYISSLGLYYYRARFYHPRLGRFMQTDPIGYGSGMNLYAYVLNDPINLKDPTGLRWHSWCVFMDDGPQFCHFTYLEDHISNPRLESFVARRERAVPGSEGEEESGEQRGPRRCSGIERALQDVGEEVANVGTDGTLVGVGVATVGGVVAVAGALTGDVPMAAFGAVVIGEGGTLMAGGGALATAGAVMQMAGGRPNDVVVGAVVGGLTRALPLPEAARTYIEEQAGNLASEYIPQVNSCSRE